MPSQACSCTFRPPSKHSALFTDRDIERSTPSVDSLQLAANIQTAYLADALRLRYAQTQRLNRCLVAQLQALDSLHYASAQLTAAERSVATDAVTAAYYRAVAYTLSVRQYTQLRHLEKPAPTQLALAVITRP